MGGHARTTSPNQNPDDHATALQPSTHISRVTSSCTVKFASARYGAVAAFAAEALSLQELNTSHVCFAFGDDAIVAIATGGHAFPLQVK
ncbi:MAG TPA: hypothetical protein VGY54_20750 [Polyangiaceae bacterium]|jgi:hypothetical protein|nr:hypothetical protein [Polyangiaceae bacterium]